MIRLVIFDWAGTLIDFGSLAPLEAYREVFAQQGVEVSSAEIRVPMGMHKRDHLRALLTMPEVVARWKTARGELWDDADVDRMYHEFMPIQLRKLREFDRLIPETLECVRELRNRGIKIGTSTGYFREATELVVAAARDQGFSPDCTICADDVPSGRPAPWMVFRAMERLGVYPPSAVVKVGDTVADVQEGVNAGVWSVGITTSGSEVGLSELQWNELTRTQKSDYRARARGKLSAAKPYAVIDTLAELPALIDTIPSS